MESEIKAEIENLLHKTVQLSTKLGSAHNFLRSQKHDQEQRVIKAFQGFQDSILKELNFCFLMKESYILNTLKRAENRRSQANEILKMLENECPSQELEKVRQTLKDMGPLETVPLDCVLALDYAMQHNFDIHNFGFVRSSTRLPKDLKFYVTKSSAAPFLEENETIYIRVLSNNGVQTYDPFLIHALVCSLDVPQKDQPNAVVNLACKFLKDGTYQFPFQVKIAGKYVVQILLYGIHILDSPSSFDVIPASSEKELSKKDSGVYVNNSVSSDMLASSEEECPRRDSGVHVTDTPSFDVMSASSEDSLNQDNRTVQSSLPTTLLKRNPYSPPKVEYEEAACQISPSSHQKEKAVAPHGNPSFDVLSASSEESLKQESEPVQSPISTEWLSRNSYSNEVEYEESMCQSEVFPENNLNYEEREERMFWRSDQGWAKHEDSVKARFLWKSSKSAELRFPIGVHPTPEDNIVVCDTGHHRVVILNNQGEPIASFGKEGKGCGEFFRPSAVVVLEDKKIVIKDDHRIQVFSPNFEYLWSCRNVTLHKAYGLAVDGHGRLVTLDVSSNSQLCYFSPNGELIGTTAFQALYPHQPNSKCRFLDADESKIAVVDLGLNCIYMSDFDGQLLFKFGCRGRNSGQFQDPAGISIDQDHNMFIADSRNSRVQVFNLRGEFKTYIDFGEHGIHRPSDICLTRTGKLLVLNYVNHNLSVYDLES